jgi:hypothetical protein
MARNSTLSPHHFCTSWVRIGAPLAAAAVAALVTIVPEWRTAYAHADNKKANEKNILENSSRVQLLPDVESISAPVLISDSNPAHFKFLREPGNVYATVAAVSSLESPFTRVEKLLFLARPVSSDALQQDEAFTSIYDTERASTDSTDDVMADSSLSEQASAQPNIDVPFPPSRPVIKQHVRTANQSSRSKDTSTAVDSTRTASFVPSTWVKKLFRFLDARGTPVLPSEADRQTAVYDIEEHVVYLPNGEELEAHSGLGQWLDDPRFVHVKSRGPTPPNIYRLTLREKPFHGVKAVRLNPVGNGDMHGRRGMLAHPYMLGADGQSNGCVSLREYPKFLQAFLKGDINRLIVVAHLDRAPSTAANNRINLAVADPVAH